MCMSKVHDTIKMIVNKYPEMITVSTTKDVVDTKADDYLLTIMRSNIVLFSEMIFADVDKGEAITITLMVEKLYDLYMGGKDATAMCNLIQERLKEVNNNA